MNSPLTIGLSESQKLNSPSLSSRFMSQSVSPNHDTRQMALKIKNSCERSNIPFNNEPKKSNMNSTTSSSYR
jgi:hypothetical protein